MKKCFDDSGTRTQLHDNLEVRTSSSFSQWLFVEEIFYMFTHWTIKMTFLIFYLRLSPDRTFRRCCFATMVLNTACMITNWLLAALQCIPIDAYFNPAAHPEAACINRNVLLMGPFVLVSLFLAKRSGPALGKVSDREASFEDGC